MRCPEGSSPRLPYSYPHEEVGGREGGTLPQDWSQVQAGAGLRPT